MDIDQLKSDPSVIRLYQDRLPELKQEGRNWTAHCPFHPGDRQASFKVDIRNKYLFRCFGCGAAGSIVDFVMKYDKVDLRAALKVLQGAPRKEVEKVFKPFASQKQLVTIPLATYEKYEKALEASEAGKAWLKSRGIDMETARRLHTGFRQDVGKLCGPDNADIADKGWIVFPCLKDGQVVSIKYRSIIRKAFTKQPGMQTALYNIESIDPLTPVFLVEGEVDALTFEMAGFNAVSLPSASIKLTPDMKADLHVAPEIILAGDSDSVGQDSMNAIWSELKNHTFLLKWPDVKDSNEFFLKNCSSDLSVFRTSVDGLISRAKAEPAPHIYSVTEALLAPRTTALDDPNRLHWPWKSVDSMLVIKPGNTFTLTASSTKTGKSTLLLQALVHGARKFGEVPLYYATEAIPEQYFNMITAHLTQKDRTLITQDNRIMAANLMGDARLYIGQNPQLNRVNTALDFIERAIDVLGATIVILDHIHWICRNEENPIMAQENAMQRVVAMAKSARVKFGIVGQPRKPKQQQKGPAGLYEFKGSEAFESDPDGIYIMHREFKKNISDPETATSDPYEPETIIRAVGRELAGGNTVAKLWCNGKTATFTELSYAEPPMHETSLFTEGQ